MSHSELFSKGLISILFFNISQWKGVSQRQAPASLVNFDALGIGLKRFSTLLSKTLTNNRRQVNSLNIGTYVPYRVDSETCKVLLCYRYLVIEEISTFKFPTFKVLW